MKGQESDFEKLRNHPRHKIRIPNALRVISPDGECVADLLDVSVNGVGIEYFDMLNSLSLKPGDTVEIEFLVSPNEFNSPTVSEIIRKRIIEDNPDLFHEDFETGIRELGHIRFRARVAWTYLNRLGFELTRTEKP